MASIITLVGRVLLVTIFLVSGLAKIGDFQGTVSYMTHQGIPAAPFFLYAAALVELAGCASVMTGYRARYGALVLALYLVPVTYIFHYQPAFDPMVPVVEKKMQLMSLLKNLGLIGGLLLVYGNGAGKMTLGKDA